MEALKNKLKSRRGASILLAMLLLLVCAMVGASVIMAAASNAGKFDSNRTEQQKYLAVSSALTLLVEELEDVEYAASYTYVPGSPGITINSGGAITAVPGAPYTYTLKKGVLRDKTTKAAWGLDQTVNAGTVVDGVLPLHNDLDHIVAKQFDKSWTDTDYDTIDGVEYTYEYSYTYKTDSGVGANVPPNGYTLTVQVGGNYGGLTKDAEGNPVEVEITVKLADSGDITLEASLEDYSMEAVLTCDRDPRSLKAPDAGTTSDGEIGPVGWKLDYIAKK